MTARARAVGVVVVTHGQLATELLNAAEMIVGSLPRFAAVSIGWHDDVSVARVEIERAITKVAAGGGVFNETGATLTVINSTFSGNTTPSLGGALFNAGTATVASSTLSGNSAQTLGGGIYTSPLGGMPGRTTLTNAIVAPISGM